MNLLYVVVSGENLINIYERNGSTLTLREQVACSGEPVSNFNAVVFYCRLVQCFVCVLLVRTDGVLLIKSLAGSLLLVCSLRAVKDVAVPQPSPHAYARVYHGFQRARDLSRGSGQWKPCGAEARTVP